MGITRSEVTAWWADQIGLEAVLRSAAGAKRPLLILTWLRPLVEDDVADPVRARVGGSLLFSARESGLRSPRAEPCSTGGRQAAWTTSTC